MSLVFNRLAKSLTAAPISSSDAQISIARADFQAFLGAHADGDYFYCALRDASDFEIIKVNYTGSNVNTGLSVERGQQGTAARAWPSNTLIYQDLSAAGLESFEQKGVFRTVDYNPNGVLVSNYAGEKVYQSDTQNWWKSIGSGTVWKLIAGVLPVDFNPTFGPSEVVGTHDPTTVVDGDILRPIQAIPGDATYPNGFALVAHEEDWASGSVHDRKVYMYTYTGGSWTLVSIPNIYLGLQAKGKFADKDGSGNIHIFGIDTLDSQGFNQNIRHIWGTPGSFQSEDIAMAGSSDRHLQHVAAVIDDGGYYHIVYTMFRQSDSHYLTYYKTNKYGNPQNNYLVQDDAYDGPRSVQIAYDVTNSRVGILYDYKTGSLFGAGTDTVYLDIIADDGNFVQNKTTILSDAGEVYTACAIAVVSGKFHAIFAAWNYATPYGFEEGSAYYQITVTSPAIFMSSVAADPGGGDPLVFLVGGNGAVTPFSAVCHIMSYSAGQYIEESTFSSDTTFNENDEGVYNIGANVNHDASIAAYFHKRVHPPGDYYGEVHYREGT